MTLKFGLLFIICLCLREVRVQNAQVLRSFKLQKAGEKCKEYSEFSLRTVELLSLLPFAEPSVLKVPDCQKPADSLIVGGKSADNGEFPHMAAIGYQGAQNEILWKCGGSLISERYVLTAAHCALSRDGRPVKVRLGTVNLNQTKAKNEDFNIVDIIVHPNYQLRKKYNDIAILKLNKNVTITKDLRPACLWPTFNIPDKTGSAIGWGITEFGGARSEKLLKVSLNFYNNEDCGKTFHRDNTAGLRSGITAGMLCAGHMETGKDTCYGDSGGPLMITTQENRCVYFLVGITSFGRACGIANVPAVYTRVSSYIEWIVDNVWPMNYQNKIK